MGRQPANALRKCRTDGVAAGRIPAETCEATNRNVISQLKLFDKLDQWIRRRIRMCYWKRWRYPRTRSRELMRLGGPRRQALRHGKSRKGYWHMAKTIASGVGLTNAWLQEQGLLSLKSLWADLATPDCEAHRSNRLMRTRMSGGVGRVTGNGGPYPI